MLALCRCCSESGLPSSARSCSDRMYSFCEVSARLVTARRSEKHIERQPAVMHAGTQFGERLRTNVRQMH